MREFIILRSYCSFSQESQPLSTCWGQKRKNVNLKLEITIRSTDAECHWHISSPVKCVGWPVTGSFICGKVSSLAYFVYPKRFSVSQNVSFTVHYSSFVFGNFTSTPLRKIWWSLYLGKFVLLYWLQVFERCTKSVRKC